MSEIQDLKNHVTAMPSKINHIADMMRNSFTVNDKMKVHMIIKEDGVKLYTNEKSLFVEL